jgi:glycerol-3-phosphate dehydrogenase
VSVTNPVLILGAGINGAALARELLLNGVPVTVVDRGDVAGGATAYSSRLIHGGLRYLEYGDFALVRESLAERTRLLRLAPQFVHPLRLFIPVSTRFGGLGMSLARLLGRNRPPRPDQRPAARGMWLVRAGLWFYDRYARDRSLPRHRAYRATSNEALPVDRERYHWQCAYYDAQVRYPERFTLALLEDARRLAAERGIEFRVLTYHVAELRGTIARIAPSRGVATAEPGDTQAGDALGAMLEFTPSAIVNATGAWVDGALRALGVPSRRLMGGTKGSHIVTWQPLLVETLAGRGVYVEAGDGRPVFILPWGDAALVGTTDQPYVGDPADAVAGADELEYLVGAVNEVFPQVRLTIDDVDQHYSGVRPLPYADAATPGAITRRHAIHVHAEAAVPLVSLVGGKLTTCRSLAEEATEILLPRLGLPKVANSRDRELPGGAGHPSTAHDLDARQQSDAAALGIGEESLRAAWALVGTRAVEILSTCPGPSTELLPGTALPVAFVRHVIHHEWVETLDDLIERRLMLLYQRRLTLPCLLGLAELLVEAGRLPPDDIEPAIAATRGRLLRHFGKHIVDELDSPSPDS